MTDFVIEVDGRTEIVQATVTEQIIVAGAPEVILAHGRRGPAGPAPLPIATTPVAVTPYNVDINDAHLLVDATAGLITINLLPAATAGDGYILDIKLISADNSVIMDGDGVEVIDGELTQTLIVQYDSVSLLCDGTAYWIR